MKLRVKDSGVEVEVDDELGGRLLGGGAFDTSDGNGGGGEAPKTVADLTAEIKRRNEGRDASNRISLEGNKADLILALQADDEAT